MGSFGPRTAHVEMADAISRLKRRRAKGIVFDLRGNGGGLVTEAQLVASIFPPTFVRFGGGHEGLLPVRRLRGDWWELDEFGTMLTGERTGETIRLGDPVRVKVERVEIARGRVDLVPAEAPV